MKRIIFVCLGNICRSPLAHAALERAVVTADLQQEIAVESAGTSAWHEGEYADARMVRTAAEYGIEIAHLARSFRRKDFAAYDCIVAMDSENYRSLTAKARTPAEREKIFLYRDFDPEGEGDVPDPYYGGADGFHAVIAIVMRTTPVIVDFLRK